MYGWVPCSRVKAVEEANGAVEGQVFSAASREYVE